MTYLYYINGISFINVFIQSSLVDIKSNVHLIYSNASSVEQTTQLATTSNSARFKQLEKSPTPKQLLIGGRFCVTISSPIRRSFSLHIK